MRWHGQAHARVLDFAELFLVKRAAVDGCIVGEGRSLLISPQGLDDGVTNDRATTSKRHAEGVRSNALRVKR
jgi:hypothetical protein